MLSHRNTQHLGDMVMTLQFTKAHTTILSFCVPLGVHYANISYCDIDICRSDSWALIEPILAGLEQCSLLWETVSFVTMQTSTHHACEVIQYGFKCVQSRQSYIIVFLSHTSFPRIALCTPTSLQVRLKYPFIILKLWFLVYHIILISFRMVINIIVAFKHKGYHKLKTDTPSKQLPPPLLRHFSLLVFHKLKSWCMTSYPVNHICDFACLKLILTTPFINNTDTYGSINESPP